MRSDHRAVDALREIEITTHVSPYAEGSCFIKAGNTHVICAASVETRVPPWMRNTGKGWVTAEYGMLPRSTHSRMTREAAKGKQSGRTQEIQRLIGRSLRAVVDLEALGENQITVDCDVIQADGGTRTASITGGFVALHLALQKMVDQRILASLPLNGWVAAVSCGIVGGTPLLDLAYEEDSNAEADANFVLTDDQRIIEVQCTAEDAPFPETHFSEMFRLAKKGVAELVSKQQQALGV